MYVMNNYKFGDVITSCLFETREELCIYKVLILEPANKLAVVLERIKSVLRSSHKMQEQIICSVKTSTSLMHETNNRNSTAAFKSSHTKAKKVSTSLQTFFITKYIH